MPCHLSTLYFILDVLLAPSIASPITRTCWLLVTDGRVLPSELWLFRPFASSPPGSFATWLFRSLPFSPPSLFVFWLFRPLAFSFPGSFALWLVCLLAYSTLTLDDSPLRWIYPWFVNATFATLLHGLTLSGLTLSSLAMSGLAISASPIHYASSLFCNLIRFTALVRKNWKLELLVPCIGNVIFVLFLCLFLSLQFVHYSSYWAWIGILNMAKSKNHTNHNQSKFMQLLPVIYWHWYTVLLIAVTLPLSLASH